MPDAVARPIQRPESTYRLQFHAGFTFAAASEVVDYLHRLGITHCYASPYLKAAPGSTHGYDVIDHNHLNPEVGTETDYEKWVHALTERRMSHILDIVPNHVGIATNENMWWNDILEDGQRSPFAQNLDINWDDPPRQSMAGKVLVPVLGDAYGKVLEKGELKLLLNDGQLEIDYYQRRFPLAMTSYTRILSDEDGTWSAVLSQDAEALESFQNLRQLLQELNGAPEIPGGKQARHEKRKLFKAKFAQVVRSSTSMGETVANRLAALNGTPDDAASFDQLDKILGEQNYRLACWRIAPEEINYRRFFNITDLAALRMERETVFAAAHQLVLELVASGKVSGLRVDHPDGLFDPRSYFQRLADQYAAQSGQPERCLYLVAEKILAMDESLPRDWRVDGATGYDFLAQVNGLFVDPNGEGPLTRLYEQWTGDKTEFANLAYAKKRIMLAGAFAGDLLVLGRRLDRIAQSHRATRDYTEAALRRALGELIACFGVYRTYITSDRIREEDREEIQKATAEACRRNPDLDPSIFDLIRDLILQHVPELPEPIERELLQFTGRFQQLTAPVTAKGIEDTAFYLYNRLVSLNEVGGDPDVFGVEPARLHAYLADRQAHWPFALSCLSTHDTKRSEDVRARISVLSELPDEWSEHVTHWRQLNEPLRRQIEGRMAPTPNDEYLLYQTLIGAWPIELGSPQQRGQFSQRIQAYMVKAVREGKTTSNWEAPDEAYESAIKQFADAVISDDRGARFQDDFLPFQKRISDLGMTNSLAQTLLRLMAPGVPDTYQGTEVWDFSLVDPDNRRPVDFASRDLMLRQLESRLDAGEDRTALAEELLARRNDGRIKLYMIWQCLQIRRNFPRLFSSGLYIPLTVDGSGRAHVFAFLRRDDRHEALVAVPRLLARHKDWGDTRLLLSPQDSGKRFRNVFTGQFIESSTGGQARWSAADLFADLPVALLIAQ